MLYTSLKCKSCNNEFILLNEHLLNTKNYIVCPYCSSRDVVVHNGADNLKGLMKHRSYKRVRGALRQK
ncbi:hypothetical protein RBU49_11690 [Clostridium sp. MB40-C1]|uniref:hypothetical protein n=1 Tax=Clostridium sp. MB40-C1 TaxID=3070996 RepID=UPI0027E1CADD|nr:hypothetical protein [Clostridium sp. MB40-C1]WMJ79552.1 hypothetical protein RBU49_11690 [Clostridium sp. MB40-C1]